MSFGSKVIIKSMEHHDRILKYVLIPEYLDKLATYGNLKEALLKAHMAAHDQIVKDFELEAMFIPSVPEEVRKKTLEIMRKTSEEKSKQNIDAYLPIMLNQTLVTLCTVLDTYLVDCLQAITTHQPNVLKGLSTNSDVNIDDLFNSTDLTEVIKNIREKIIDDFDFMGIEDKLNLLSSKLGVKVADALQLKPHNQETQDYYSKKPDFLFEIYKRRKRVVHKDEQVINTLNELTEISTYISYFILDLGFILGEHFKIDTDFGLFLNRKPVGLK